MEREELSQYRLVVVLPDPPLKFTHAIVCICSPVDDEAVARRFLRLIRGQVSSQFIDLRKGI